MAEQLQEMKARLEAATPGRWNFDADGWLQSDDPSMDYILFPGAYTDDKVQRLIVDDHDAAFIAHAPEVQAKLIAALEAVLARHERGNIHFQAICLCCDTAYPCATVRLIAEALA